MTMESQEPPAVLIDQASKWYGQVIGINDLSLAIDGGVTGDNIHLDRIGPLQHQPESLLRSNRIPEYYLRHQTGLPASRTAV